MPQEIREGTLPLQLIFTFPDDWNVSKFDDTSFYRNRVEKLNGIKAVDIIARNNDSLQFIEVKDFRTHRIENTQRQKNGELVIEVAQKFVSTIAALLGSRRWGLEEFTPYNACLNLNEQSIEVILFIERDETERTLMRAKLTLADLKDKLKKLLVAYKVQCKVYDRNNLPAHIVWTVR